MAIAQQHDAGIAASPDIETLVRRIVDIAHPIRVVFIDYNGSQLPEGAAIVCLSRNQHGIDRFRRCQEYIRRVAPDMLALRLRHITMPDGTG